MKNMLKLIGIVALVAVIGFSMVACGGGGGGGKRITPDIGPGTEDQNSVIYAGYANKSVYILKITENTARYAAQTGDNYELFNGGRVNKGTVTVDGNNLTLSNTGGDPITVTVSGTAITAMDGTIKWENGTTESAPDKLTSVGNDKSILITGLSSDITKAKKVVVVLDPPKSNGNCGDQPTAAGIGVVIGETLFVDVLMDADPGSWEPDNTKWTGGSEKYHVHIVALSNENDYLGSDNAVWYVTKAGGVSITSAVTVFNFTDFKK